MSPPPPRGPTRRRQADRRAETRRKLLDAAVVSLVENGFAGTTVGTIASAAGVTRGALNHHFDSKIELMLAAAGRVTEDFVERLTSRLAGLAGSDPYERALRSLWEAIYREPMFVARLELLLGARSQAEIIEEIKAELLRGHLNVHRLLSDAFERSDSPLTLSQEVLDLALTTLRGLALEMIVRQDEGFADRQLRLLADAVRGLMMARSGSAG
ncbi:MAG: TetR/AcrR family transcriptional regulator [Rhodospirillaceae bacterium]|nr:TetR/AcrR family transcriptional regulator [Rhodospirillaceae bacterium]